MVSDREITGHTYYDPDVDKLYQYVKIGDFPPEWVVTNIDEDEDYYDSMGLNNMTFLKSK